jgi:glutamate-ammonia-ligase adenylyltransferase
VQLFSLFEANPPLVDLIVDIASTSPALARYLSRNASVLDAVIGGSFFAPWPGIAILTGELAIRLSAAQDYEKRLNTARTWVKEWHFRIGVHHLRGLIDAFEAGKCYADLAEAVLQALWPVVRDEFSIKHGPPPGRGATVVGMGSLGAGRLNANSDLDLIVIYDPMAEDMSHGPRPLATRPYFARLTQALVTALTAQTAEGRLYEVDMRLRPSGRQGPVATSFDSFRTYQETEAWTWEHLALTRARPVAGNADLGAELEAFRRTLLLAKGQGATVIADVADMRSRLQAAKPANGIWEGKNGPGRLMDIELLAQTTALLSGDPSRRTEAQLQTGLKSGVLTARQVETLLTTYRFCWRLQAAGRLLSDRAFAPDDIGEGGKAFLLRETGATTAVDLTTELAAHVAAAAEVIDIVIGGGPPGGEKSYAGR